jgi:hypothetical protein
MVRNQPNAVADANGLDGVIVLGLPASVEGLGVGAGGLIGIAGAFGIGLGLLLDYYTPIGDVGTLIANWWCRPKEETCVLVQQVEQFCIYKCPGSGAVRVSIAGPNGCADTKNFPVPGPYYPGSPRPIQLPR